MKHHYTCKKCGESFSLPNGAKFCPICSGELISKTQETAKEKVAELKSLLPELERKYNEFAELYVQFKMINETLRTYAARGVIDREMVIDFKPETLTEKFYKNRKHKNKKNIKE